jgi:anaerobic selenocysteine-containing dehydrogenase
MIMRQQLLLALAAAASLGLAAAYAAPVSYTLPEETAAFKPGANLEVVQNNCTACHSADYIKTQPRGEKFKKDFWTAEVTKMIKVYGAPIEDADVGKIVDYHTANYCARDHYPRPPEGARPTKVELGSARWQSAAVGEIYLRGRAREQGPPCATALRKPRGWSRPSG